MQFRKEPHRIVLHLLSMPFIYGVFVPAVLFDLSIEIYHRVCFPMYGLPYIKRSKYIRVDRHRLSYLNPWEKLNCIYCGYMNGLFYYICAIGAATEEYWCGIKHEKRAGAFESDYHKDFLPFNDEQAFQTFLKK